VTSPEDFAGLREAVSEVHVAAEIKEYLVRIVQQTRIHPDLALGASVRASLGLLRSSQALAVLEGRGYVIPDDIKRLAEPILLHRLVLKANAELRGTSGASVLEEVMEREPVPIGGRRAAG
jgi:MoxR-like ATPase